MHHKYYALPPPPFAPRSRHTIMSGNVTIGIFININIMWSLYFWTHRVPGICLFLTSFASATSTRSAATPLLDPTPMPASPPIRPSESTCCAVGPTRGSNTARLGGCTPATASIVDGGSGWGSDVWGGVGGSGARRPTLCCTHQRCSANYRYCNQQQQCPDINPCRREN